jgi:FemAB-related protein (PEP-CTERM system-associated)
MEIEKINLSPFSASQWDAYVNAHPEATAYHQYRWSDLIARTFGHRALPLMASQAGRTIGVLPLILMDSRWFGRFLVSLPFVNYGGLLADSDEIEQAVWQKAQELGSEVGAAHIEARHLRARSFITQRKQHKVTMVLPLAATSEAQWKGFDPKLRNQIRKAERSGLTVRIGGASDLPGFYQVFARNMRDLGTPVYTRRFFEEIFATFPGSAWVCSVRSGSTVVAAAIALGYRDTFEVPWASSLRDYRSLCPNNLLYWALIQQAIMLGYRRFDFGRSTPGEGTYKFKEQWGAGAVPLSWEYWTAEASGLPDLSPKNPKYQLATSVWKHLPTWLTKQLGPSIVRNIP